MALRVPVRMPADAANGWKLLEREVESGIERARGDSMSGKTADRAAGETRPGILRETVFDSVNVPLIAR